VAQLSTLDHMARHIPKLHSTVLRLEQQLFYNAHNLLMDACVLYQSKSFPTAFALAVLAYEELGKLHLVDHVGAEARLSDPSSRREQLEHLFSRELAFNHIVKQRWALSLTKDAYSDIYHNGRLDHLKQAAFYVGFRNGRIRVPDRLSATTAFHQIRRVVTLFKHTKDLPFLDLFEDSTPQTRSFAERYISSARRALSSLTPPRKKLKKDVRV
jgi:AbiV family abortive infection protein